MNNVSVLYVRVVCTDSYYQGTCIVKYCQNMFSVFDSYFNIISFETLRGSVTRASQCCQGFVSRFLQRRQTVF